MTSAQVRPGSGLALAITITALFALTACGGSSGTESTAEPAGSRAAGPALADTGAAGKAADTKQDPAPAEQAIISTGTITSEVGDMAKARTQVQHVTDKHSGQVAEQETGTDPETDAGAGSETDDQPGHTRMVLRIPSASFAKAMAELEKLGTLVDSSTTSTDVTTEVVDTDVRVKNARASIDRIRTLLARAERIGDVISIESELASREAELNSLLAQQAHLADQTSLSTITISISRAGSDEAGDSDAGFLHGLSAGWGALGTLGIGVATAAGALLPWVPVIALVGVPLWLLVRRRRHTAVEV